MRFRKRLLLFLLIIGLLAFLWFQWWHLSKSVFALDKKVEKGNLSFTLAAPLPARITEAGGVSIGDKFYILGGIDPYGRTTNKFWRYDPLTDNWTSLPEVPAYINHPGVMAIKNKIYVVGGFDPIGIRLRWLMFADWKPLTSVYIFDLEKNQWETGPPLPEPLGAGGIASTDSAIWYAGGINQNKKISSACYYLSLATMTWTKLPEMPTARDHLRMELAGNKLYAISGREDDLRKNLGAVEIFDLNTQTWSKGQDIPTPRGGFSSIVFGKYIYTFGGESFFNCFDKIERLDTASGHWEQLPALPEARHGIISGVLDGKIHLVSGGRHPRISTSNIHRVLEVKEK